MTTSESPNEPADKRLARLEHQLASLDSQILNTNACVWPEEHARLLVLRTHRLAGIEYVRRLVEVRK